MTPLLNAARICRRTLILGLVFLIASIGERRAEADPLYTITDLGTLPGTNAGVATAINNNGQVVGISYNSADGYYSTSGSAPSFIYYSNASTAGAQSFLYSGGVLGPVNSFGGLAHSINDSGQVVGGPNAAINDSGRFVNGGTEGILNANGTTTPVSGPNVQANAINDAGMVAGSVSASNPGGFAVSHAAVSLIGQVTDLSSAIPVQGGTGSNAIAINQQGNVIVAVDQGVLGDELYHTSTGEVTGLPMLSIALNNNNQILTADGQLYSAGTGTGLGLNGTLQTLLSLIPANSGWTALSPTAINDAGQIVGSGVIDGQTHAFLMTPEGVSAPEPGTLAVWGTTGAALGIYLLKVRR